MQSTSIPLFSDNNVSFLQQTLAVQTTSGQSNTEKHGLHFELLEEGVLLVEPKTSQGNLVLSAGVHGNETAPIEMLDELVNGLLNNTIQLKIRLLLILGNPPAMRHNRRFNQTNLNRLFNPELDNTDSDEAQRANKLMELVSRFFTDSQGPRFHYDLHTAIRDSEYEKFAVYPYNQRPQPWSRQQLEFLGGCDVAAVLLQNRPSPTFSWYSGHYHDAHAFTLELGKARPFGDNDHHRLHAIKANLIRLIQGDDCVQVPVESMHLFAIRDEIIRHGEGFELLFPDDLPNFSRFIPGSLISRDDSDCYTITGSPGYIIFPNANVELGARAALIAEDVDASALFPPSAVG